MPDLTSPQNPRVKNAVRLRDRRHREKQGKILIDGARELRRAIAAGVKLTELFVCPALCQSEDAQYMLDALPQLGGEVLFVSPAVFQRLAFGQRAEGVLGIAEMPRPMLATISASWGDSLTVTPTKTPLVAVLEGVEKPGNVGAVLRSADAVGVSAVIVADGRTDLFNPNAIRASLGTIFTTPACEATSEETLAWLRARNFSVFAARVDGSVPYGEVDYRGPTAIVLGSEAAGLSSAWTGDDIRAVRLPMLGKADSLNVSVTAAVLFYEALRQRQL
jgi:TrmH family RNA methyltransferase